MVLDTPLVQDADTAYMLDGAPSIGRAEGLMLSEACEGLSCGAALAAVEHTHPQCFFRYAPFPVTRSCDLLFPPFLRILM